MNDYTKLRLLPFIILVFVLIILSGLSARPGRLGQALSAARIALTNQEHEHAANQLAYISAAQPWRDTLWETAGRTALAAGAVEKAIHYLEQAKQADLITAAGWAALGDSYLQAGQVESALTHWTEALAAGYPLLEIENRRLEQHLAADQDLQAIQSLEVILTIDPENAALQYQLGLLFSAYQPALAWPHLQHAADLDPLLAPVVDVLKDGLDLEDEPEEALRLVRAGRALGLVGEWELAVIALESAVRIRPDFAEGWAFLGEAYAKTGQDGRPFIEHALAIDPESIAANLLHGLDLRRSGQASAALPYLLRVAELDPRNPIIQAEIGSAYDDLGDFNEALMHFIRATELAPGQATY